MENPVDAAVAAMIKQAREGSKGFSLSLANEATDDGKVTTIEVGQRIQEFEYLANSRAHTVGDVQGLVAFAQKYGDKEKSVIFVDDGGAHLILFDHIERGQRETIRLHYNYAQEWKVWNSVFNTQAIAHRDLLTMLLAQRHTLVDPTILDAVRSAPLNAEIKSTSVVTDHLREIGYFVRTEAGEELKKFPESFKITLPILDVDVDEGADGTPPIWPELEVWLIIFLPDDATRQPVRFGLRCPKWLGEQRRRIELEYKYLSEQLEGWLILRGNPEYTSRPSRINP